MLCPGRLTNCCKQMLRSFCPRAAVTVVDRLRAKRHRNSVSIKATWAAGAANLAGRYRKQWPSADTPCASGGNGAVVTRGPWWCSLRCGGVGELLGECMRPTGSSVNNERVPEWVRFTSRPLLPGSQPTSESEVGASVHSLPPAAIATR